MSEEAVVNMAANTQNADSKLNQKWEIHLADGERHPVKEHETAHGSETDIELSDLSDGEDWEKTIAAIDAQLPKMALQSANDDTQTATSTRRLHVLVLDCQGFEAVGDNSTPADDINLLAICLLLSSVILVKESSRISRQWLQKLWYMPLLCNTF